MILGVKESFYIKKNLLFFGRVILRSKFVSQGSLGLQTDPEGIYGMGTATDFKKERKN